MTTADGGVGCAECSYLLLRSGPETTVRESTLDFSCDERDTNGDRV